MNEPTPHSNAKLKRAAAARHNARYEARQNQHYAYPLFDYIAKLVVPVELLKLEARHQAKRKARARGALLIASTMDIVAMTEGRKQ